jgi:hypothetical protein
MFCRSSLALRKSGSRTVPGAIPDLPCADAAGPFETRTFAEDAAIREVRHAYLLKEEAVLYCGNDPNPILATVPLIAMPVHHCIGMIRTVTDQRRPRCFPGNNQFSVRGRWSALQKSGTDLSAAPI